MSGLCKYPRQSPYTPEDCFLKNFLLMLLFNSFFCCCSCWWVLWLLVEATYKSYSIGRIPQSVLKVLGSHYHVTSEVFYGIVHSSACPAKSASRSFFFSPFPSGEKVSGHWKKNLSLSLDQALPPVTVWERAQGLHVCWPQGCVSWTTCQSIFIKSWYLYQSFPIVRPLPVPCKMVMHVHKVLHTDSSFSYALSTFMSVNEPGAFTSGLSALFHWRSCTYGRLYNLHLLLKIKVK